MTPPAATTTRTVRTASKLRGTVAVSALHVYGAIIALRIYLRWLLSYRSSISPDKISRF